MEDSAAGSGQVWLRSEQPRKERITRERIVAAAIALLDEEGAERLTMRRIAERLDTGSTTLYGHVRTKDDVLDLALDAIVGEVPLPEPSGADWKADVVALMREWRAALLRHPWSTGLLGRPMLGPNMLAREEFLHRTLAGAGFGGVDLNHAAYALANYVVGTTITQTSWLTQPGGARQAADEHVRACAARYPTLAAHRSLIDEDWDTSFRRGLEFLLDGLRAGAR